MDNNDQKNIKFCSKCNKPVLASYKFCPKCGAPMERSCDYCNFILPKDAVFCPSCGNKA